MYGTGSNNLYQHYLQYGKAEGRKPVASADTKSSTNVTVAETKAEAETTASTEKVPTKIVLKVDSNGNYYYAYE